MRRGSDEQPHGAPRPHGLVEAQLPLDHAPYEALVTAALARTNPTLSVRDYERIALQPTGHARALAADVARHVSR
ncbi:hypothetical protein ACPCAE_33710 [Streptomyces cinereoruber]|uniref:hypothetical protein n=1 Tax=Streptomyces cinereoruber TaxID=67260 RepID=UPI003C2D731E